jgi:hypothetical protein
MNYETKIIEYKGKFYPVVKGRGGFEGIEQTRYGWFKKGFKTWSIIEYIEKYCSCKTYIKASEILESYLDHLKEEEKFKESLKG